MHAGRTVALKLGQHPHRVIQESQASGGPGYRGELVGDAQPRDDAVDLVVQMDRARLRIDARPTVEDQAVDAVLRQQGCGGDTGGPCTHDDDGV